ncbi:S24 family peptidase [Stella sp.]|uniref:S24 family peptidase n=1 Tax=Stella sp. TaxID=2912054 RepID=UPI0035B4E503
MVEPSDAARGLKALREEAGLSMRQAADALGMSLTGYQHYEDRFKKPYLPVDLMRRVAGMLAGRGIAPARVLALAGTTPELVGVEPVAAPPPAPVARPRQAAPVVQFDRTRRLPVYGSAQAGPDGQRIDFDPIEWIDRPDALREVNGAFAMYVVNDSMEPKYEQGDMLYVHPTRPPKRLSHVVIVKTDDTALVKRLVRAEVDAYVVRQYNPPCEYAIPRREVKALYLVMGSMDGR